MQQDHTKKRYKKRSITNTAKIRGAVRFGIGPFNTEEHILAIVRAVGEIASFKKR